MNFIVPHCKCKALQLEVPGYFFSFIRDGSVASFFAFYGDVEGVIQYASGTFICFARILPFCFCDPTSQPRSQPSPGNFVSFLVCLVVLATPPVAFVILGVACFVCRCLVIPLRKMIILMGLALKLIPEDTKKERG